MSRLPKRFWVGLIGLLAVEGLLFGADILFIRRFFTPLVWTAYILLVDGLIERVRGSSPLTRSPAGFAWTAIVSIGIWYVFEAYNLRMTGWRYDGLPESYAVRVLGYFWAFATIGPGMFVTRELVELALYRKRRPLPIASPGLVPGRVLVASGMVGLACLVSPFLVSTEIARYLWAPVWAGFIFAVDPINARLGRGSVWSDLYLRDSRRLVTLLIAGAICGLLWEGWNYWAETRWVYTFPFADLAATKLFEMPVVGFIGFPPFAVEYFVVTELVSRLWHGDGDLGAPRERRAGRTGHVSAS